MKHRLPLVALAVAATFCTGKSYAQGIPVIDIANLIQTIQQVMNDITKIQHQVSQIQQLQNVLFRWQSRFVRETGGRARANLAIDGGCDFTLSATSVTITPAAATNTLSVLTDPGCSWSASGGASWLTITSGATGSGTGTVTYTTAANTTASARSATLTIAGQPFVVTQGVARRRTTGR